jgi:hypothetical protein
MCEYREFDEDKYKEWERLWQWRAENNTHVQQILKPYKEYCNINVYNKMESLHYSLLSKLECIKQKLTDAEYKDIIETLMALRNADRYNSNKAKITDILDCVFKSIVYPNENEHRAIVGHLRPLEAINVVAALANILNNLKKMSDAPDSSDEDEDSSAKDFIFNQLTANYTGDYHKTILQLLDYGNCKKVLEIIESLEV